VDLVQLLEGDLEGVLVFSGDFVQIFAQFVGGLMHEHLCVLDVLAVAKVHVDELCVLIDLLKGVTGLIDVAIEHLFAGEFGHCVDEFGVEEALVAGSCLFGAKFELSEALGVGKIFVVGGESGPAEREEQCDGKSEGGKSMKFHTHLEGALLRVFEGDEAVAGLPLLIRKLAVCHGEELPVQVGCLFDLVELVMRSRFKEQ
jgi:hypothetical protein